ncbi:MAG: transposase [Rhizobacter sp.]|nr:transposase [Bacteriovorax sp.]
MKKTLRKNSQLTFLNPKGAGRKAIHDKGIRHIEREAIKKDTVLHLTLKITREKAALKNKMILKCLHHSIKKARGLGLKVIQYTLEYDHIHLLVEASDKVQLGIGMQSLGISLSKGINKIKAQKGKVFKNRYHFRKLSTPKEIKNVLNYILGNGIKHKETTSIVNPYNSLCGIKFLKNLYPGFELMIEETIQKSHHLSKLREELKSVLTSPRNYHLRQIVG